MGLREVVWVKRGYDQPKAAWLLGSRDVQGDTRIYLDLEVRRVRCRRCGTVKL